MQANLQAALPSHTSVHKDQQSPATPTCIQSPQLFGSSSRLSAPDVQPHCCYKYEKLLNAGADMLHDML